jgi:hypothetical protein
VRQFIELLVQDLGLLASNHFQLSGPVVTYWLFDLVARQRPGFSALKSLIRTGFSGRADGDRIEPLAQEIRAAQRTSLAGQHDERGLERILGGVIIAEQLPADP